MATASCSQARACRQSGRDHRKIGDHDAPTDCIFFYWKKLNCSPAFADRLLSPPKSCVDQNRGRLTRAVVWLSLNDFLLLRACNSKGQPCFCLIIDHTSVNTFHECSAELDRCSFKASSPSTAKALEAAAGSRSASAHTSQLSPTLCSAEESLTASHDQLMQWTRVGFPVQVHDRLHGFGDGVVWLDTQGAIQHRFFFSIAGEITVTQRKLLKCVQVARSNSSARFKFCMDSSHRPCRRWM